jgi:Arc/MetJ-type ribon-helix-helix transcriptional regulator
MTEYVTVKLPQDIVSDIDKLVGKHGFSSRAEVAKEALRALFRKYSETNNQPLEKLPNAEQEV